MNRKASVIWKGNFQEGTGTMSTESQVLSDTQYSFRTRFAKGIGTNPDELIAVNEIKDPAKLKIGQSLKIPAKKVN